MKIQTISIRYQPKLSNSPKQTRYKIRPIHKLKESYIIWLVRIQPLPLSPYRDDTSGDFARRVENSPLLKQMREVIRARQYSIRTEETYLRWVVDFFFFHKKRDPAEMGAAEVEAFLNHLTDQHHVAASTQNQAFAALLFLYANIFGRPRSDFKTQLQQVRAKKAAHLPIILSKNEVQQVLRQLSGEQQLIGQLLYGSGLRLLECLRLRVNDIDFEQRQIVIHSHMNETDTDPNTQLRRKKTRKYRSKNNPVLNTAQRITILPDRLMQPLRDYLARMQARHRNEYENGRGYVILPSNFDPQTHNISREDAQRDWQWQFVFPAKSLSANPNQPTDPVKYRHHAHETTMQKAVITATHLAKIDKRVTCHTFRHSFAVHLLEAGYDICTVQEMLGHSDITSTMIYTRVLAQKPKIVHSPLDH